MTTTLTILVALSFVTAAAGYRGIHQLRMLWRDPDSIAACHHLVRAIRALILVACSMVFMAAVVRSSKTLLVLGGIILLEEIYETGVALLILRAERAAC